MSVVVKTFSCAVKGGVPLELLKDIVTSEGRPVAFKVTASEVPLNRLTARLNEADAPWSIVTLLGVTTIA